MDYDKTRIAATYNLGRDHGPAFLQLWMDTVATQVDGQTVRNVLDLGCGTGRFSQGLATRLNADVVGVDPSGTMLDQARSALQTSRVFYVRGSAEAVPLADGSVDVIFISMVFHHFKDPQLAAQECRRVLRRNGRVLLRTASREQIEMYPYVPYFPTSRPLLEDRLPSIAYQRAVFQSASFRIVSTSVIPQQIAPDLQAYADKLATRSDSILISLRNEDFEAGLKSIRSAPNRGPIVEPIDFIVAEKLS